MEFPTYQLEIFDFKRIDKLKEVDEHTHSLYSSEKGRIKGYDFYVYKLSSNIEDGKELLTLLVWTYELGEQFMVGRIITKIVDVPTRIDYLEESRTERPELDDKKIALGIIKGTFDVAPYSGIVYKNRNSFEKALFELKKYGFSTDKIIEAIRAGDIAFDISLGSSQRNP